MGGRPNVRTAGPAADLYALGGTLYFLLTGRPPFSEPRHASAVRKMVAHLSEPAPDLSAVRPDVPPAVCGLYRRLTAKEPADRPRSAAAVAAALLPFRGPRKGSPGKGGPPAGFSTPGPEVPAPLAPAAFPAGDRPKRTRRAPLMPLVWPAAVAAAAAWRALDSRDPPPEPASAIDGSPRAGADR